MARAWYSTAKTVSTLESYRQCPRKAVHPCRHLFRFSATLAVIFALLATAVLAPASADSTRSRASLPSASPPVHVLRLHGLHEDLRAQVLLTILERLAHGCRCGLHVLLAGGLFIFHCSLSRLTLCSERFGLRAAECTDHFCRCLQHVVAQRFPRIQRDA